MSKYRDLPDIDVEAKDVFETLDAEVAASGASEEQVEISSNADIINLHISAKESAKAFRDALLDSTKADFSDTLSVRRQKMYQAYTAKHVDKDATEFTSDTVGRERIQLAESPVQKLQRLLFETQELESEMARNDRVEENGISNQMLLENIQFVGNHLKSLQDSVSTSSPQIVTDELKKTLYQQVEAASVAKESTSSEGANSSALYEVFYTPTKGRMAETSDQEIDARIGVLEKILGISNLSGDVGPDALPLDIIAKLNHLESQLGIFADPNELENISKKSQVVASELDILIGKRFEVLGNESGIDQEVVTKIDALYSSMNQLSEVSCALPAVLDRLNSLKHIHAEAAAFSQTLSALSDEQHNLTEKATEIELLCTELEKNLLKNQAMVMKNVDALNAKIETIKK